MRRTLVIAALVSLSAAADAGASFSPPVELLSNRPGLRAAAATDAAGTTTVVINGPTGTLVHERPRGGAWSAPALFRGGPVGPVAPVVDAAGSGALVIAWRGDRPNIGSGIAVALRDPGGTLSERIVIAGPSAGGVRNPAVAIDGRGDVLLAYDTGTLVSLHRLGKIAVTYRPAGGAFSKPVVVDGELAGPPAVALAPDGTGVVVWERHHRAYAVAVGAGGWIGRTTKLSSASALDGPTAAAGERGAATIVWTTSGRGTLPRGLAAVYRPAGSGAFGPARHVANDGGGARAAADEDGRMLVAWITDSINAAFGVVGQSLGAPHRIVRRRARDVGALSVAAAGGRAIVAWGYRASERRVGVQAVIASQTAPGPPQTVARLTVPGGIGAPDTIAAIDPQGRATVLFIEPWARRDLFVADGT